MIEATYGLTDPRVAGQAAMSVISALGRYPRREQIVALGATFLLACRAMDIHTGNVLTVAENVLCEQLRDCPEWKAVRDYLQRHVIGGEGSNG